MLQFDDRREKAGMQGARVHICFSSPDLREGKRAGGWGGTMGDAGGQKHALPKSTDFEDPP